MSAAACGACRADVIRWNELDAGQGGEVEIASLDTAVLRYDGHGRLIVPTSQKVENEARDKQGETRNVDFHPEVSRLGA